MTIQLDERLELADWPKRTPDTFEALGIKPKDTEQAAEKDHDDQDS